MAHGDKRWITDVNGRIIRSTDRTYKDWKGSLQRFDPWRNPCDACKAKRAPYDRYYKLYRAESDKLHAKYGHSWYKHADEMQYPYRVQPYHDRLCDRCRRLDELNWKWHGPKTRSKRWTRTGVPKSFRQGLNRNYRAKMKQAMRNGNYDNLPQPKRNAAWLYW